MSAPASPQARDMAQAPAMTPAQRAVALGGLAMAAELLDAPLAGGAVKARLASEEIGQSWTRTRNALAGAVAAGWLELVRPAMCPAPAVYRVTPAGAAELAAEARRLAALAGRVTASAGEGGGHGAAA